MPTGTNSNTLASYFDLSSWTFLGTEVQNQASNPADTNVARLEDSNSLFSHLPFSTLIEVPGPSELAGTLWSYTPETVKTIVHSASENIIGEYNTKAFENTVSSYMGAEEGAGLQAIWESVEQYYPNAADIVESAAGSAYGLAYDAAQTIFEAYESASDYIYPSIEYVYDSIFSEEIDDTLTEIEREFYLTSNSNIQHSFAESSDLNPRLQSNISTSQTQVVQTDSPLYVIESAQYFWEPKYETSPILPSVKYSFKDESNSEQADPTNISLKTFLDSSKDPLYLDNQNDEQSHELNSSDIEISTSEQSVSENEVSDETDSLNFVSESAEIEKFVSDDLVGNVESSDILSEPTHAHLKSREVKILVDMVEDDQASSLAGSEESFIGERTHSLAPASDPSAKLTSNLSDLSLEIEGVPGVVVDAESVGSSNFEVQNPNGSKSGVNLVYEPSFSIQRTSSLSTNVLISGEGYASGYELADERLVVLSGAFAFTKQHLRTVSKELADDGQNQLEFNNQINRVSSKSSMDDQSDRQESQDTYLDWTEEDDEAEITA